MAERGRKSTEIYRLAPGRSSFHTTWVISRRALKSAFHCLAPESWWRNEQPERGMKTSSSSQDCAPAMGGIRRPSSEHVSDRPAYSRPVSAA